MNKKRECCICSQIAGAKENDLISELLDDKMYVRRVALESNQFAVIPSLGPLVLGHTLLCPKKHYKSFSCLPKEYDAEFKLLKTRLVRVLTKSFRAPVHCFEHGMTPGRSRVLCSVGHAHMHFVPANVNIWGTLNDNNGILWKTIQSTLEDLRKSVGKQEYIFYEGPDDRSVVTQADEGHFESQYMRQVFANALGKANSWNWRENPGTDIVDKTFKIVRISAQRNY